MGNMMNQFEGHIQDQKLLFDAYGEDAKSLSVYTSNVGAWSGSTAARLTYSHVEFG